MEAANDNAQAVKTCNACRVSKPVSDFNRRTDRPSGIRPECRECQKERTRRWKESDAGKARITAYNDNEEVQSRIKEYHNRPENKIAAAIRHKKWRDTPDGKKKLAAISKRSFSKPESKARRSERRKSRYREDAGYAASVAMRSMLSRVLKATMGSKTDSTFGVLGYSPEKFRQRIECQFLPGMSWENRSHSTWHIDHKKPVAAFIAQGITDPAIINALSNLRPMFASENMTKGAVWQDVDYKRTKRAAA